jgi:hypothetical protein
MIRKRTTNYKNDSKFIFNIEHELELQIRYFNH